MRAIRTALLVLVCALLVVPAIPALAADGGPEAGPDDSSWLAWSLDFSLADIPWLGWLVGSSETVEEEPDSGDAEAGGVYEPWGVQTLDSSSGETEARGTITPWGVAYFEPGPVQSTARGAVEAWGIQSPRGAFGEAGARGTINPWG